MTKHQRTDHQVPKDTVQLTMRKGEIEGIRKAPDPKHMDDLTGLRRSVYSDVNALVAAQLLEGRSPARVVHPTDGSWGVMASAMLRMHENIRCYEDADISNPVFEVNPPDLPPELARSRVDILENHGRICDIPAMVELAEIEIARLAGRPVDKSHFSEASRNTSWMDRMNQFSEDALDNAMDKLNRQISQGYGDDPVTAALFYQQFNELSWCKRNLEPSTPTPSFTVDDYESTSHAFGPGN